MRKRQRVLIIILVTLGNANLIVLMTCFQIFILTSGDVVFRLEGECGITTRQTNNIHSEARYAVFFT